MLLLYPSQHQLDGAAATTRSRTAPGVPPGSWCRSVAERSRSAAATRHSRPGSRAGPRGRPAVSEGSEVVIAGRVFRLGVVYAPAPRARPYEVARLLPLRLVSHDPAYPWPGGCVEAELVPAVDRSRTQRRRMSGRAWAAWAGDPVEDDPGNAER